MTSADAANWHPVTWLSHMLDVQLNGMNAGAQHTTNLLLHILNVLLLFGSLYSMTRAFSRSLFVAGLFAVHPLHVESVAWIAERKDVLSTLFWMLTMWAWVAYVRRPARRRYLLVLLLFGLGLMAKPMLVTLPFVLLLLDFWPLRRVELEDGVSPSGPVAFPLRRSGLLRLVSEKLPLFALAAISGLVTVLVQRHGGAIKGFEKIPLSLRLINAPAAYLAYIGKMLWPLRLAAFYPFKTPAPVLQASLGALLLIGVTAMAVRAGRRNGYILVGWLWYVGTLVPVIGLVQVGDQSMADRYTYVPLIGLSLIAAWGIPELVARWRFGKRALPIVAGCILLACAALAEAQVRYWSDDVALWQHALTVTRDNYVAEDNLAVALATQGRAGEAVLHFAEAFRIRPSLADSASAQNNLGMALMLEGKLDEAALHFVQALRIEPDSAEAHYGLGAVLLSQRKPGEAVHHFTEALRIKPGFTQARDGLNLAQAMQPQDKQH